MLVELVLTFTEGFLSFISPCLLPMLPIYYSYLAGDKKRGKAITNSIGFVLGFTTAFTILAVLASYLGIIVSIRNKVFICFVFFCNYFD